MIPLPHDLEAERALLTLVAAGIAAMEEIVDAVSADDFFARAHELTYRAATDVHRRGAQVEPTTLRAELVRNRALAEVGGDEFLLSLDNTMALSSAVDYAKTVRDLAHRRRVTRVFQAQVAVGYDTSVDTATYLEQAEAAVLEIVDKSTGSIEVTDAGSSMIRFWKHASEVKKAGGLLGVRTGIPALDAILGGFWIEQMTTLGGRPSMGKTALLETCSVNALAAGHRPLFLSLEMPESILWPRLLAKVCEIDSVAIREQTLTPDGVRSLTAAMEWFKGSPFRLVAKAGLSIGQIRSVARKEVKRNGVDAIYVDYLQKIRPTRKHHSREQEVAEISNGLHDLALELKVPVIVGAQVNRGNAARADKRPALSDLRESGAIENDSDNVILIHRPAYYRREQVKSGEREPAQGESFDLGAAELIVEKNRNGPTDVVECRYRGEFCLFHDPQAPKPVFKKLDARAADVF